MGKKVRNLFILNLVTSFWKLVYTQILPHSRSGPQKYEKDVFLPYEIRLGGLLEAPRTPGEASWGSREPPGRHPGVPGTPWEGPAGGSRRLQEATGCSIGIQRGSGTPPQKGSGAENFAPTTPISSPNSFSCKGFS